MAMVEPFIFAGRQGAPSSVADLWFWRSDGCWRWIRRQRSSFDTFKMTSSSALADAAPQTDTQLHRRPPGPMTMTAGVVIVVAEHL